MLSRVAAVNAPRTHNRRRVTGSSGRRREGRESEPQRPHMSRHLFYSAVLLVLVVMMFCCGSGAASNENTLSDSELSTRKLFHWKDTTDKGTVISLFFPSLVELNGDLFAVAGSLSTKKNDEGGFAGIASELLTWAGEQAKELDKTKLKTQVLEECPSGKEECPTQAVDQAGSESGAQVLLGKPTTVVQRSDIYMVVGMYNLNGAAATGNGIKYEWGLLLARGNVSIVDDGDGKRIYWTDVDALPISSNTEQYGYVTELLGSGGSGVKMEDGTLVFPLEGQEYRTVKANDANTASWRKRVSLFIYSPDNKSWALSKGMSDGGCSALSVVEWKDKKLMMMTACDGGRQRVYESGDKGESWTEALGTLSRVWGNKHNRYETGVGSGFITATVGDDSKKVMLVTLPVYSSKGGKEKGVLHLWLTDNTHIVDIGPVSEEDDDAAASTLLYKSAESKDNKDEKLIALYEKKKKVNHELSYGMVSARLTAQLQRVKEVLKTWKKVDESVSQLCTTLLAQKVALSEIACTTDKITDGLVGFLSGNFSDNTWKDEYLGVNATINNKGVAKKTDNGVNFTGRGAGAQWPVGSQGENQLYHFANYNFTLVATVSIDGEPKEGNIPLLGVRLDGEEKLMELSYDGGKKWILLCGDGTPKEHSSTWEKRKTQHVVLLIRNGSHGSAYVDGQRVGGDEQCKLETKASKVISHFYIGGDGGSADSTGVEEDVSVTVTNVLLYNRPLNSEEIDAFDPNKAPIPLLVNTTIEGANSSSTAGRQQQAGKEPLLESSIANGETAGGTNGQEEEVHPQVGDVNAAALNSSLGNVSQGNNSDAGTLCESGLLPSLLLLLGLWGFAAL
ncbi:putative trans-sialidase, Group VI [Trypanosoma cruzi]|uniref:Trans-sialidase, putative n=2 Tax=Trypanosoma cruzi TaxID=5693 RepID=Q4E5L3_TRYCC|nr:trans-sialidase, putative [Trypanosoma cruzi]EAO00047.1 trans-sialidase, putative [Trypanosoma cruzi]PWU93368.1 putative trans-sialidase, Group VI [Trypanosoma cruzi]|eukprot:XP_821898.1 trans-sialidase [Trypanosoma cruzi strain CL Brener]